MKFPEQLKIAINQTEEASKRCRWIIFIMQLTVVLVLSSLWLQEDANWLKLRINVAQAAVKLLTCEPQYPYRAVLGYPPGKIDSIKETAITQTSREELDTQRICSKTPILTPLERKQALEYLDTWHYSLPQAQKNVADLQQLISTRMLGVTVPVLGIMFDINDLSVMAGLTFAILLSWFHFALRRQHDNIRTLFELAEAADRESKNSESRHLKMAYDLLAMTQVLTIPPGHSPDSRNISLGRRLSRLPNLIMWTAVLTQSIVLIDDIATMKYGDTLGEVISHVETAIASCLLAYLFYRTILGFRLLHETYDEWSRAYKKIHPAAVFVTDTKMSKEKMALLFLVVVAAVHMIGEKPGLPHQIFHALGYIFYPLTKCILWIAKIEEWLTTFIVLPAMVLLYWHAFRRPIRWIRPLAWAFGGVVVLDLIAHLVAILQGKVLPSDFQNTMVGLFSLPVLLLASLNMVSVLRTHAKKASQPPATPDAQENRQVSQQGAGT